MLQSNALSDKCGHKATYEKSKVCGAASQEGTRREGEGSQGEWRFVPSCKHLQKPMGATIIVLGAAATTSSATTAAAAARGDHIAQHVAQCEKLEQRSTSWRRAANSCRVAARAWATTAPQLQAQLQPVSCAPPPLLAPPACTATIHHIPHTPIKHTHHMHTVIWNTHSHTRTKLVSTIGQQNMPKNFPSEQSKLFSLIKQTLLRIKWTERNT